MIKLTANYPNNKKYATGQKYKKIRRNPNGKPMKVVVLVDKNS